MTHILLEIEQEESNWYEMYARLYIIFMNYKFCWINRFGLNKLTIDYSEHVPNTLLLFDIRGSRIQWMCGYIEFWSFVSNNVRDKENMRTRRPKMLTMLTRNFHTIADSGAEPFSDDKLCENYVFIRAMIILIQGLEG